MNPSPLAGNHSAMPSDSIPLKQRQSKGRWMLIGLFFIFALPAIMAKTILSQHWYQSGVTNKGQLIEPRLTYADLNIQLPAIINDVDPSWHLGYVLPSDCQQHCQQQLHLLKQSHTALGKYQPRVLPTVFVASNSDTSVALDGFTSIVINDAFLQQVSSMEYLITDPLGQLVMKYPATHSATELVAQNKGLLSDLRKLLKLSRVG